jgi:hypothetical protein
MDERERKLRNRIYAQVEAVLAAAVSSVATSRAHVPAAGSGTGLPATRTAIPCSAPRMTV